MFGSMSQSQNLDAEVEAEEKAVQDLKAKYLGKFDDDEIDSPKNDDSHHQVVEENNENMSVRLEANLNELSSSIDAKEELIQKLLLSQEKYEVGFGIHVSVHLSF